MIADILPLAPTPRTCVQGCRHLHPGLLFLVVVSIFVQFQVVFTLGFTLAYLISPHFCHRSLVTS